MPNDPDADLPQPSGIHRSAAQPESSGLPLSFVRRERRLRELILDYALGASILGLIPIQRLFTLRLVIAAGVILKMIWDIGNLWGFRRGQDLLAIMGYGFGSLGAFAMAFGAWLTLFGIGIFVPYVKGLAYAAALFTLTWGLGQATRQFYASSNYASSNTLERDNHEN
jgi:uncharacterized protein (DUF697 family)